MTTSPGGRNLGPDVQDLFIERVNPDNQISTNSPASGEMELIWEEIRVSGQEDPVILTVRKTHHGPIINDVAGGVEAEWDFGWQPLAFAWTALEPGTLVESLRTLNHARNWDEFRQALSLWDVPSQNFVYADVEGNIGYQASRIGRAAGNGPRRCRVDRAVRWIGVIRSTICRSSTTEGFIATASNAVVGGLSYFLHGLGTGIPGTPSGQLLQADDSIAARHASHTARQRPLYAQDLQHYFLALQPEDNRLAQALDLLRSWDGRACAQQRRGSFRPRWPGGVFEDELGAVTGGPGGERVAAAA
jgi:penicillin amidase